MKRLRAAAVVIAFGGVLAWSGAAIGAPLSNSQDPAQLSTAALVFVKVDPATGTDTILVVNRQQAGSATTPGSALPIHVRFYDANCFLRFDNDVLLTPQGFFADTVSHLFGVSAPGLVLADFRDANPLTPTANSKFAVSAVIVDGNFGAIYERQGSPLLQPGQTHPPLPAGGTYNNRAPPVGWGGFSYNAIDDWFIGGFTMIQMICPGSGFDADGNELEDSSGVLDSEVDGLQVLENAQPGGISNTPGGFSSPENEWANSLPQINVYDAKEVLKRSIHNVPCFCNTDSAFFGKDSRFAGYPGDLVDVIASMKAAGVGTVHLDPAVDEDSDAGGNLIAWRVIGDGKTIYWSARMRTTPLTGVANEACGFPGAPCS